MRRGEKLLIAVTLACLAGATASAKPKRHEASSNALIDAVAACRGIAEEKARLACYDAASARLAQAVESQSLVVLDQQAIKDTRRSLFGFTLPDIPFLGGDSGEGASQLETTIAAASPLGNGRWQIRLEDGAVWQTTEASLRLSDPKAGQKILIKRGALGNYFMRINGQLGIRGRRIS